MKLYKNNFVANNNTKCLLSRSSLLTHICVHADCRQAEETVLMGLIAQLRKVAIDLIRWTIFDYVIHFRMAKAHERPYATVCKAVSKEA